MRVNDRGPFVGNRIIDLSYSAAKKVGIVGHGTGLVEVRAIDPRRPEPQPIQLAAVVETIESSYPTVYIQVGAFSNRQNAEQLKAQLTLQGVDQLQIQSANARSKLLYKVRIGPLASVNDADTAAEYLENLGMFDYSLIID